MGRPAQGIAPPSDQSALQGLRRGWSAPDAAAFTDTRVRWVDNETLEIGICGGLALLTILFYTVQG